MESAMSNLERFRQRQFVILLVILILISGTPAQITSRITIKIKMKNRKELDRLRSFSPAARLRGSLSHAVFLRRPTLSHELEQMRHCLLVGSPLLFGELPGALIELLRHPG